MALFLHLRNTPLALFGRLYGLYEIERAVQGPDGKQRKVIRQIRQKQGRPAADTLYVQLMAQRQQLSEAVQRPRPSIAVWAASWR